MASFCHILAARAGERQASVCLVAHSAQSFAEYLKNHAPVKSCAPVHVIDVLGGVPLSCRDIGKEEQAARLAGKLLAVNVSSVGLIGCAALRRGAAIVFDEVFPHICVVVGSQNTSDLGGGAELLRSLMPELGLPQDEARAWDEASARTVSRARNKAGVWDETRAWDEIQQQDEVLCLKHRRLNDAAQVVASYLRCHPRITKLYYPGLRSDSSFTTAAAQLNGGFGPLLDFELDGPLPLTTQQDLGFTLQRIPTQENAIKNACDNGCENGRTNLSENGRINLSENGRTLYRLYCTSSDARALVLSLESLLSYQ